MYQEGIMRVLIGVKDSDRFRISQHGISVEEDNLIPVQGLKEHTHLGPDEIRIQGYESEDGADKYTFTI